MMVRLRLLALVVALVLGVGACASFRPGEDNPARSLEAGLGALAAGDHESAAIHFDRAGLAPASGEAGRRALLLGALLRLDPRTEGSDLTVAAARAAALQAAPGAPAWEEATAILLQGVAAGLADARSRVRHAESERHAAVAASILASASATARLNAAVADRDAARRRVTQLEQTLAEKEKELKEKTQELERIRRAIRG